MKKILLTLTLALAFIGANAQCTPDPQYTINDIGIWPDSAEGVPVSIVGSNYNEFITIITPSDTLVDGADFGFPAFGTFTATVDDVEITNVTGLPPNFNYACDPVSCIFPGGEIKCAKLFSTSIPTASDIGVYNVIIATEIHTSDIPFLQTFTINDTIDYYTITISGLSSVFDKLYEHSFELKDISPNPVSNNANIQFISGNSTNVVFTVFSHLGKKIEEINIAATRGVNNIKISANNYDNGIYLYSINNGFQIVSKRMVVVN